MLSYCIESRAFYKGFTALLLLVVRSTGVLQHSYFYLCVLQGFYGVWTPQGGRDNEILARAKVLQPPTPRPPKPHPNPPHTGPSSSFLEHSNCSCGVFTP